MLFFAYKSLYLAIFIFPFSPSFNTLQIDFASIGCMVMQFSEPRFVSEYPLWMFIPVAYDFPFCAGFGPKVGILPPFLSLIPLSGLSVAILCPFSCIQLHMCLPLFLAIYLFYLLHLATCLLVQRQSSHFRQLLSKYAPYVLDPLSFLFPNSSTSASKSPKISTYFKGFPSTYEYKLLFPGFLKKLLSSPFPSSVFCSAFGLR